MANKAATLYIHYKKADGKWAYAKPVVKANGRIKPLYVLADGKEKHHLAFRLLVPRSRGCSREDPALRLKPKQTGTQASTSQRSCFLRP